MIRYVNIKYFLCPKQVLHFTPVVDVKMVGLISSLGWSLDLHTKLRSRSTALFLDRESSKVKMRSENRFIEPVRFSLALTRFYWLCKQTIDFDERQHVLDTKPESAAKYY